MITAAVALLAVAVAAVLAILAHAVLTAEALLGRDGARIAAGAPPAGSPGAAGRAADSILALGDDRDYRRSVGLVLESRRPGLEPEAVLALQARAESELLRLARTGDSAALRSAAANLDGALLFESSRLDDRGSARLRVLALQAFRESALIDPDNEAAKRNVELLQTILARQTTAPRRDSGGLGDAGAGATPAGEGF